VLGDDLKNRISGRRSRGLLDVHGMFLRCLEGVFSLRTMTELEGEWKTEGGYKGKKRITG
jgi:hypothetical protein